jgi:hypothetical protein
MSALSHSQSHIHSSRCPLALHPPAAMEWLRSGAHPPPSPSLQVALNAREPHKVAHGWWMHT